MEAEADTEGLEPAPELSEDEALARTQQRTPPLEGVVVEGEATPDHGGLKTSLEDVSLEEEPTLDQGGLGDELGVFDGNFTLDHFAEPSQWNNTSL